MKKRALLIFSTILLLVFSSTAQTSEEILQLLKDRVDVARSNVSIAVAVVDEKGTRFVSYGKTSADANAANVDEHTLYELGSITKTFTGTLFAEAIRRGEVKPDDPISKYLPMDVKTPKRNGKEITLIDLVTHTSGLPRMPSNMDKYKQTEIYDKYTAADAYEFLSKYELPRDIGAEYEYSNFGMGLLGHILSLSAKMPFAQLVKKRILEPLKMTETFIVVPEKQRAKLALGYDTNGDAAISRPSGSPIFLASGSIRSTAADMAKYTAANLGLTKTPISESLSNAQKPLRPVGPTTKIGYAWHVVDSPKTGKFAGHGGATYGYMSDMTFDRERKCGVVVLTNSFEAVQNISSYIFDNRNPRPIVTPYVSVKQETLQKYEGVYEFAPEVMITVTRDGQKLYVQLTGQEKFRVFPKSETVFYLKVVAASIAFNMNKEGKAESLTLNQGGKQTAKKIK